MKKQVFILIAALTLGACQMEAGNNLTSDVQDACGAQTLAEFIGKPQSTLDWQRIPSTTRLIAPGDRVTKDYVKGRLNIYVNEAGIITQLTCG